MRLGQRAVIPMVLAAVVGAPLASAQTPRFLQPSRTWRLEAGSTIEVSWAVDPDPSFEEMELVLSLDGGRSFPLRVTGEISPEVSRILWRVPDLPTLEARLALRAGSDEEPGEETILIVSDVFEIAPLPRLDLEDIVRERGEWRTREARRSSRGLFPDQEFQGGAEPRVEPSTSVDSAGEPPPPAAAARPALRCAHRFTNRSLPIRPAPAPFDTAPLTIPLRQ